MTTNPIWLALGASLLLTAPAFAACDASISKITPVNTINYDPFDGVAVSEKLTVELKNNGDDACTVSLAIASTTPGSQRQFKQGGNQILYQVETPGGTIYVNDITLPAGSIPLPGRSGGDGKVTTDVKIKIPAGLISPAGNYTDTLTLRLFQNTGSGTVKLGNDQPVQARAAIESRAQVNIAGTAVSYGAHQLERLDFGSLSTNAKKYAVVQVRTTRPVSISVTSLNQGVLKHKTIPTAQSIPYAMVLDSSTVTFGTGAPLTRSPIPSLAGTNYNMLVTIGDTTGRPAGAYTDRVTVTVMPQ